jgi:hypothetical protein
MPSLITTKQFGFNGAAEEERTDSGRWAFAAGAATSIFGDAKPSSGGDSPNDPGAEPHMVRIEREGASLTDGAPYWEWTGTWEQLGVPAGATVKAVNLGFDWRCDIYSTGAASAVGPAELRSETGTLRRTFSTSLAYSATSEWATREGANQTGLSDSASTKIKLRLNAVPKTGASGTADNRVLMDWVVVTIEYSVAGVRTSTLSLMGVGR